MDLALIHRLHQKVDSLRTRAVRFRACHRVRYGDSYTVRRRIINVGSNPNYSSHECFLAFHLRAASRHTGRIGCALLVGFAFPNRFHRRRASPTCHRAVCSRPTCHCRRASPLADVPCCFRLPTYRTVSCRPAGSTCRRYIRSHSPTCRAGSTAECRFPLADVLVPMPTCRFHLRRAGSICRRAGLHLKTYVRFHCRRSVPVLRPSCRFLAVVPVPRSMFYSTADVPVPLADVPVPLPTCRSHLPTCRTCSTCRRAVPVSTFRRAVPTPLLTCRFHCRRPGSSADVPYRFYCRRTSSNCLRAGSRPACRFHCRRAGSTATCRSPLDDVRSVPLAGAPCRFYCRRAVSSPSCQFHGLCIIPLPTCRCHLPTCRFLCRRADPTCRRAAPVPPAGMPCRFPIVDVPCRLHC